MNAPTWWPLLPPLLALCVPLAFSLGVLLASPVRPLQRATLVAWLAFALSLLTAATGLLPPPAAAAPNALAAGLAHLVRLDAVTRVMLVLVGFIAVVIARYSRSYLAGDPGRVRYARALLATLAAVTALVLANNLLVLALAWMATSFPLHQLLTFYRERAPALVAAHKKFLLSRLADACMLGAVVLLWLTAGSLRLDALNAWADARASLPPGAHLAAVLLVLGASLKSAQLPFHGWLIQVMEAPTPVSALLHAGVVNIGGFVMIRLAPLMARAPLAQALLVLIGTVTAVVAALVMTTRVSVKVALAWSTCAQMGFMLVECGLGAWHLALLHLVAHSLYKAHAFLSAGTAVDVWRVASLTPRSRGPVAFSRVALASALVFGGVAASVAAGHALLAGATAPGPTLAPLTIVLGLSLAPLFVRALDGGLRSVAAVALRAAAVGALYFGGHAVAARLLVFPEPATPPLAWVVVLAGFGLLFGVQMALECRPDGGLARALQPRLFAGLYLDEGFTRLTFRLWPPRMSRPEAPARALAVGATAEAR